MASSIVNSNLDPNFDYFHPLANLDASDFAIREQRVGGDTIVYTLTDPTRAEQGKQFSFSLASRFRTPDIPRRVQLPSHSNVYPTALPYSIYSLDRLAQLEIAAGTTMSLDSDE